VPDSNNKTNGIETGRCAAAAILALRANDHADRPDPLVGVDYFPSLQPGKWCPDPVSNNPLALGAYWGYVRPFVVTSTKASQVPPPPALNSAQYTTAFNEIKQLGGDGITTPTVRTREQTLIGIYWGYDGTPYIGTRPRQYNQIAVVIARQRTTDALEMARLLALFNAAVADSSIVTWGAKYGYDFWRPVTAVREAGPGTGPTGLDDGNPDTGGDPAWTPLGSPASNTNGAPNFTPPFPSYPSGHAVLGSAAFEVLRSLYGTDKIAFTFVSDELNGITRDNHGNVRPRRPRSFSTLTEAEQDNGVSRFILASTSDSMSTTAWPSGGRSATMCSSAGWYSRVRRVLGRQAGNSLRPQLDENAVGTGRPGESVSLLAFARYRSIPHDILAKAPELATKPHDSRTKPAESSSLSHVILRPYVAMLILDIGCRVSCSFGLKSCVFVFES
jgi:hypothetical protein